MTPARPHRPLALIAALLLAALPARAGDNEVRAGTWSKRKVPDGWVVVDTPNYQVQCQVGKDKAELLGDHLEGMRLVYKELLSSRRAMPTFVVKVFADREQFLDYLGDDAGEDSVNAWFDPVYQELVTFDTGIMLGRRDTPTGIGLAADRSHALPHADLQRVYQLLDQATVAYTDDTARVLSHEGWHQYFQAYTVSEVPMPAWLDEGVGEFYYTANPRSGSGGRGYETGALNQSRLRDVLRAYEDGRTKHFRLMLQYDRVERFAEADVFYAQGWSMVQFLMTHQSSKYRALIPNLLRHFKDSKNFRESTAKVFKGFDLDELHREWLGWLLVQIPDDPLKELAREFGTKIRPEELLAGDDVIRDAYLWHLRNPHAPTRVPPRDGDAR